MKTIAQSPKDHTFVQDPYRHYEAWRVHGDFVFWDEYGMPAALSHRAVQKILRDKGFARLPPQGHEMRVPWDDLPAFKALEDASMLSNEAPRHPVLRRSVVTAFSAARVQGLEDHIITLCHSLIDQFPHDTDFDLLTRFATPIPVRVIAHMLGQPIAACERLLEWSHAMVKLYIPKPSDQDRAQAEAAAAAFTEHMRADLATRQPDPNGNLAEALLFEADQGRLSDAEVIGTCVLLLNAGHEATVHALGNAAHLILKDGHQALASDPQLTEECLRLAPPLHIFTRYTQREIEVFGHVFRPGQEVACLLAAANRDPSVFPNPSRLDVTRDTRPMTSFGAGVHFCLGAPLARLELTRALRILFERCPNLQLVTQPEFSDSYHFHGLKQLMVRLSTKE